MELRATLLGNHARNVRNARNARNVRARARARARWIHIRTSAGRPTHTARPTHNPPHAHCPRTQTTPASSHGDMGRGRGQVRD